MILVACGARVSGGGTEPRDRDEGGIAGGPHFAEGGPGISAAAGGAPRESGGEGAGAGAGNSGGREVSDEDAGSGVGGYTGASGAPGAGGGPRDSGPAPDDWSALVRQACMEYCETLYVRCDASAGIDCSAGCDDVVDSWGPCPELIDYFQCVGAAARQSDRCVGADVDVQCISFRTVVEECGVDPH